MRLFLPHPRQRLTEATDHEIRSAISHLIQWTTNDYGYYLLLVLSVIITSAGLLINSSPVIIGGMIIAPLLIPLLACGLALLLLEFRGFWRACSILLFSVILTLLLSYGMALLLRVEYEITYLPPSIPWPLYLLIAIASGVVGTYAFVKQHLSSSISGVAVSVSLLPPLCAVGIGLALDDRALVSGSLLIFLLNVFGIMAAAFAVFWVLGFRSARGHELKAVERAEKEG